MIQRKLLAAILSSFITAFVLSVSFGINFNGYFNILFLNMMIVCTYGVVVSWISDWITGVVFKNRLTQQLTSLLLHILAALGLKSLGVISATLFFLVDRVLQKFAIKWRTTIIAILFVIVLFFIVLSMS